MANGLALQPRYLAMIEATLQAHAPGVEVWAFGSRVKGTHRDGSDLDLVLRSSDLQPLPPSILYGLDKALEESTLPILVQAHDWARLPKSFKLEIEQDYVILQASAAAESLQ